MSSKRITLTRREREYIIAALRNLRDETSLDYAVIGVGKSVYNDIIAKLSEPTIPTTQEEKK